MHDISRFQVGVYEAWERGPVHLDEYLDQCIPSTARDVSDLVAHAGTDQPAAMRNLHACFRESSGFLARKEGERARNHMLRNMKHISAWMHVIKAWLQAHEGEVGVDDVDSEERSEDSGTGSDLDDFISLT